MQLKLLEIDKLKDVIFMKDTEISSLKNNINKQQKQIEDLEKIQSLYANNYSKSNISISSDTDPQISQKDREIAQLKSQIADQKLKINELSMEIKSQNMQKLKNELNSYQIKYNYLKENPPKDDTLYQTLKEEYSQLESKHQVALKLIGKLWARNQTLVQETPH